MWLHCVPSDWELGIFKSSLTGDGGFFLKKKTREKRNQAVVGGPCVLMYLLGRFDIHVISDRQGNPTNQSMFYLKYIHKSHTDVCN